MKGKRVGTNAGRGILGMLLVMVLFLSTVIPSYADEVPKITIIGLEKLEKTSYEVNSGTSLEDAVEKLPTTVKGTYTATKEDGEGNEEKSADLSVTWSCDAYKAENTTDNAIDYPFRAALTGGATNEYVLADGVTLTVTVSVKPAEKDDNSRNNNNPDESQNAEGENKLKTVNQAISNDATKIYVSSAGDDNSTGTKDSPFATLTKAVDAAPDGATIYVLSDLTMNQCARFYDKHLTITSEQGGPYTITRSVGFNTQSDDARGWYNPAMIEAQSSSADSVGLTLSNIVLDDAGRHEGSVFAQAVSGGSDGNIVYVQDAIIASNATVPCTITLGDGAVLRNFGGMSAVRATDQAKIVMESGSVIEDTIEDLKRARGTEGSNGPAGAVWIQGGTLVMEEGSKIQNINGRAIYADGGKVEIGGTIIGITANKDAMWQGDNGTAIHLRNGAEGTLTSTARIENIAGGGSMIHCVDAKSVFKMENGSKITNCDELNGNAIFAEKSTVVIDGEISNVYATGFHILQTAGGTTVTIGENGQILNNHANYGAIYINGTDEQLNIYGKINGNICTDRGGGVVLSNNGDNHNADMYPGAEICNNSCEQTGGGVMVSKGTFTMKGGTISNNVSGMDSTKSETERIGGGVFVRRGGQFIMNDGTIKNNATTSFGGGVCFDASDYGNMVPKAELNGGTIANNLMNAVIAGENTVTVSGGDANDLAITGKDYGKANRYLFISDEMTIGNKAVYFQTGAKAVTPADNSLDIKLGNTSEENVTTLKGASKAKGWGTPLATFWAQRDGAATLTVGGLAVNDNLPVYVLALPVNENGAVAADAKEQVCAATKDKADTVSFILPNISGNGYAIAIVQPTMDYGTLTISGPETIEQNKAGTDYSVTYTVKYAMSESMKAIIKRSGGKAGYVLEIAQDSRLVGNPGSFNGESIEVTYSLPNSEFKAGDYLLASAKLTITVDGYDYIVPSNVAKTRMAATDSATKPTDQTGTESGESGEQAAPIVNTTNVAVGKVWQDGDNLDGIRPASVTVQLYCNGEAYGSPVTLSEENSWWYRWDYLDAQSSWTVDELNVAEGYTKSITKNAINAWVIVNTHTPEAKTVVPTDTSAATPAQNQNPTGRGTGTGDEGNLLLWLALMIITGGGAAVGYVLYRRRK